MLFTAGVSLDWHWGLVLADWDGGNGYGDYKPVFMLLWRWGVGLDHYGRLGNGLSRDILVAMISAYMSAMTWPQA